MRLDISHLGQVALGVSDVDRAEAFYGTTLGLTKLFRFGDLAFFNPIQEVGKNFIGLPSLLSAENVEQQKKHQAQHEPKRNTAGK